MDTTDNEYRIEQHKKLHNFSIPKHEHQETPREFVTINDTQKPVLAYMHETSNTCVSTESWVYNNPRKLICYQDIADHLDWLEMGIKEWRDEALYWKTRCLECEQPK